MNLSNATCVLILGMHRSGTSSLAGCLQELGLYLDIVNEGNDTTIYNKKGNREFNQAMQLNEDILIHNGGDWKKPPTVVRWTDEHKKRRHEIINTFTTSDRYIWGFKDPRTLLNLDFWLEELKNICSVKFVGTFRHPFAVAKSLENRNQMSLQEGIKLWEHYNIRLYEFWQRYGFPIVCFDTTPEEYREKIMRIATGLELPKPPVNRMSFFDETLRNQHFYQDSLGLPQKVRFLYQKLINISSE